MRARARSLSFGCGDLGRLSLTLYQISPTASFTSDLGLDSLDAVEVVMAIEEEFTLEISDADADKIDSVGKAIDYVSAQPDGASRLAS